MKTPDYIPLASVFDNIEIIEVDRIKHTAIINDQTCQYNLDLDTTYFEAYVAKKGLLIIERTERYYTMTPVFVKREISYQTWKRYNVDDKEFSRHLEMFFLEMRERRLRDLLNDIPMADRQLIDEL
jgi:hypothetical protein